MTTSNFYEKILAAVASGGYAPGVSGDRLAWFTPEVFADLLTNVLTELSETGYALHTEEHTGNFSVGLTGILIKYLRVQFVSDDDPANELELSIGGAPPFAVLNPGGVVELPGIFSDSGALTGTLSNTSGSHRIITAMLDT